MRGDDGAGRGTILRFFREVVRPYAALQALIALCLLVGVVLELVDPLILRVIVDRALGDGDFGLLAVLVGLLAVALLFRVGFRMVTVWLTTYSGVRILFDFRHRVFQHVERLSPRFFKGEKLGDILARLTSDVDVLHRAAAQTIVHAVQDVLTIVGILAVLLWLDPLLTLALVIVYPVLAFALARTNRRLRDESMRARSALGNLYSFLEERLSAMRLVQEFGREKGEARRHLRLSRPWMRSNLALSVIGGVQMSLADLMATGAFILVFLIGGARTLSGELTLGTLVAFYTLASRLYRPISGLIDINIDLQVARASLDRIYALVDQDPEIRDADDAEDPAEVRGGLRLAGAGLAWPDGTRAVAGVDLEVPPGRFVALVGPSGSGKSTLASLIARHADATEGSVDIDGRDVRGWRLRSLRRAVGLVPQETRLFHDTLRGNLRFARPHASDDELLDALETAELGDFVASLRDGLDTIVGEQGMRLSGGERQRLAIARALLKDPVVHILDEATSALDPRTERRVLERFLERVAGRTVVVIAHRLTSVTDADRVFVLDRGRLAESGTHEELLAGGGLYRNLWDDQHRAPAS